jgi:hypothetical protein
MAIKRVIMALMKGQNHGIPGLSDCRACKTKIAPPIMAAMPMMTMSKRLNKRTSLWQEGALMLQAVLYQKTLIFNRFPNF